MSEQEPLLESDTIRLSVATVQVPWPKRQELMRRLEAAGHGNAAEELRYRRAFTEAQKPRVYEVLNAWLQEVKVDEFGEELMDLRAKLQDDLNL